MGHLTTSVRGDAHAYTRSNSPWIISEHKSIYGKLIHYLSGGGMRSFGRTVRQEEVKRNQTRFLVAAGLLAALWLFFWIF